MRASPQDHPTARGFHPLAIAFAIVTAIALTWPVVLHPLDHVVDGARLVDPLRPESFMAGNIGSDVLLIAWILRWNLHALIHHPLHLFDANTFYPTPGALARTEHLFAISLLSAPGALLGGPVLGNQTALLVCVAANVWAAAWVVVRWTGLRAAALGAGVLFAASPFHQANFAHLQNLATAYLPLLLFGMSGWRRPNVRGGRRSCS